MVHLNLHRNVRSGLCKVPCHEEELEHGAREGHLGWGHNGWSTFILSKGRQVWKSRLGIKYITSGIVPSVALFLWLGIRIDHSCQVQMPVIEKSMYNFQFASS